MENRLVFEYHGETEPEDQQRIITNFRPPNGRIRLVIATVAFGLGLNIPDVRYILHWGPPSSLLDYWHEVGRAGRDGLPAHAFFYAVPNMTSWASIDIRQLIKKSKTNEIKCLRIYIFKALELPEMDTFHLTRILNREICTKKCASCTCPMCTCCSFCKIRCKCTNIEVIINLTPDNTNIHCNLPHG